MGIMLVYDITNGKTFENISKWLRNIDEVRAAATIIPITFCRNITVDAKWRCLKADILALFICEWAGGFIMQYI